MLNRLFVRAQAAVDCGAIRRVASAVVEGQVQIREASSVAAGGTPSRDATMPVHFPAGKANDSIQTASTLIGIAKHIGKHLRLLIGSNATRHIDYIIDVGLDARHPILVATRSRNTSLLNNNPASGSRSSPRSLEHRTITSRRTMLCLEPCCSVSASDIRSRPSTATSITSKQRRLPNKNCSSIVLNSERRHAIGLAWNHPPR